MLFFLNTVRKMRGDSWGTPRLWWLSVSLGTSNGFFVKREGFKTHYQGELRENSSELQNPGNILNLHQPDLFSSQAISWYLIANLNQQTIKPSTPGSRNEWPTFTNFSTNELWKTHEKTTCRGKSTVRPRNVTWAKKVITSKKRRKREGRKEKQLKQILENTLW